LHTGPEAAAAADSINARAFTVGNHVAFNRGEYNPASDSGKKVLAHELTHVRQQTQGKISLLPKSRTENTDDGAVARSDYHIQPTLEISSPDDPAEKEAERVAEAVMRMDDRSESAASFGQTSDLTGPSVDISRQQGEQTVEEGTDIRGDPNNPEQDGNVGTDEIVRDQLISAFDHLEDFYRDFRSHSHKGIDNFESDMQWASDAEADPNIAAAAIGATLEESFKLAVSQIPLGGEAYSVISQIKTEIDSAAQKKTEQEIAGFIEEVRNSLDQFTEEANKYPSTETDNDTLEEYVDRAYNQSNPEGFAYRFAHMAEGLEVPSVEELQQSFLQRWIREHESSKTHWLTRQPMESGIMRIRFEITVGEDTTEVDTEPKDVTLACPNADNVKSGLRRAIGNKIDTSELSIKRHVQIQNTENRAMQEELIFEPDGSASGVGPDYFHQHGYELPVVDVSNINTSSRVST